MLGFVVFVLFLAALFAAIIFAVVKALARKGATLTTAKWIFAGGVPGVVVGGVLAGLILLAAQSFSSWGGVEVYYDAEAILRIQSEGFPADEKSKDAYYYIDGFQDHQVFLAFSGDPKTMDAMVEKKTGKKLADLPAWQGQLKEEGNWGLNSWGPGITPCGLKKGESPKKYLTPLYDLKHVGADALFYDGANKASDLKRCQYLVYDRTHARIFYSGR